MASTIKLKNGSGAPLAGDLVQGEPALDLTNKRLYTEDSGGTVIEVGTNPAAEITANAGIALPDNQKATFGASDDLEIYSDGTSSIIQENGTGALYIQGTHLNLNNAAGTSSYITAIDGGAVTLFSAGSAKLATTSTGIDVTGTVTADGLTVANTSVIAGDFDGGTAATYIRLQDDTDNFLFGSNNSLGNFLIKNETADAIRLSVANTGDISFYNTAGTSQSLFWDASAESLGIGTTSPSNQLHVSGTSGNKALFERTGSTGAYIGLKDSSGSLVYLGDDNGTFVVQTAGSSYSTKLAVTSGGNVGIGTSSPTNALDVRSSGSQVARFTSSSSVSAIVFSDSGTTNAFYQSIGSAGDALNFVTGNADRMRIDSSGNLLVGKTATGIGTAGFEVSPSGYFYATRNGNSMALNRLTTDGDIAVFLKDGTNVGSVSVTASTTSYNTSSDQRLKENIVDAPSSSDDIDAIQVRSFDWKADGSHQKYGMIAQELMTVAPEAVSGDPESDEMMGVDYSKLVPMLIKEIQSLRARVAQLETN